MKVNIVHELITESLFSPSSKCLQQVLHATSFTIDCKSNIYIANSYLIETSHKLSLYNIYLNHLMEI
jgi:hypothetical protein